MRTVYGDHARFEQTYFSTYKGKYFTGDGCRRDADGYYWITGRVDDVINVSGHRMGTAEVESSLVAHAKVSEAAVVGYPHDIKGQGIYAYVTLMTGTEPTEALRKELVAWVRKDIGPIASPDLIQFAPGPAENPLRQDHAPHPAQDRRGRTVAASATPRRWPIPPWSTISSRTGRTRRARRRKARRLEGWPRRALAPVAASRCVTSGTLRSGEWSNIRGFGAANTSRSRICQHERRLQRAFRRQVLFSGHLL